MHFLLLRNYPFTSSSTDKIKTVCQICCGTRCLTLKGWAGWLFSCLLSMFDYLPPVCVSQILTQGAQTDALTFLIHELLRKTSKKVSEPEKSRVVTVCCINIPGFKIISLPLMVLRSFTWKLALSHCFVSFLFPFEIGTRRNEFEIKLHL